jgi:tetratricopeptide (TPR) repeat protein
MMKSKNKSILTSILLLISVTYCYSQATYNYYSNPDKIGSKNPNATEYFIKSFGFISHWGNEDTDSAIIYLRKAIDLDSTYAIAYATLGHLIKFKGYNGTTVDVDSVKKIAEKAIRLNPKVGDAYTLMSWVYLTKNENRKAIDECKKAVEVEPNHRETWFWLGWRYSTLPGTLDSSIYAFNKSLEIDSLFGQPHQKLGWIYLDNVHDYKKSAYHFRKMIYLYESVKPRDERMILGYVGLAEALIADRSYDNAIDTLNLFLRLSATSRVLWINTISAKAYAGLSRCYLGKAKAELDSFIAVNERELDKYPDDQGIKTNTMSQNDMLISHVEQMDLIDTLEKINTNLYGQVLSSSAATDQILTAVQSKIASLKNKGKYKEAIDEVNSLLIKFQNNKEIKSNLLYTLACAYSISGESDKSLKYLSLAIDEGFNDFEWIKNDPDLINIKDNTKFKKILTNKR